MAFRSSGEFDKDGAIAALIEKYGVDEKVIIKTESGKRSADDDAELDIAEKQSKKTKKSLACVCEENRCVAEAIMEMAGFYFKNGDARKGGVPSNIYPISVLYVIGCIGVFSKAAKALRDSETVIKTKKDAMLLNGIGKGIAMYVEEYLDSNVIKRLEELRAGIA